MKHIRKLLLTLLATVLTMGGALTASAADTDDFVDVVEFVELAPSELYQPLTVSREANPFVDVEESEWYYPYVIYAYENNFMSGKPGANGALLFDPLASITRAEFVQSIYNKEGKPDVEITTRFSDVQEGDWFAKAVSWAAENGIVAGKGDFFDVYAPITRQEVATVLCQYAEDYLGYSVKGRTELTSFADAGEVSDWAMDKMQWAIHYGIMAGKGEGVAPKASATRAECATMLKNFMDAYTQEYTSIGMHAFEWVTTKEPSEVIAASIEDFGSRTYVCSECGGKKLTESMVNIGDQIICGVFDDEDAAIFMELTNRTRRFAISGESDSWGNSLGLVCPVPLVQVDELNFIAKLRAAECAIDFNHDKARTVGENLAFGQSSAVEANSSWGSSTGHLRAMTNPDFTETGGACFWYDGEDDGDNLVPFRVQVFEGDGLPPIEPDEESKQIILNDETGIPDTAFYQAALAEFDRNGDGALSYGEAARPAQLLFSDKGIKDLRGIEYFNGATKLVFAGNEISDLSPLEKLTDIYWYIDLSDNQLTDISSLANVNVSELYLANNQIKDIAPLYREYAASNEDYMRLQYYSVLDLSGNGLTDVSTFKGMLVKELNLSNNRLTDISGLGDMLLQYNYGLDLSYNNISDISALGDFGTDRTPFTEVDYINLSHNQLTELHNNLEAVVIDLSYNQLTSIANPNATDWALAARGKLNVSHNQISDLSPIAGYYGSVNFVEYLNASYNNITTVEPIKNILFGELILSHNQISDVSPFAAMTMRDVYNNSTDRTFDITYNNITDLSPLKDSILMNSIVTRIQSMPENVLVGSGSGEITRKDVSIAAGNQITIENALASLPEELLNVALYIGETATPMTWLDTENYVGKAVDTSKNGLVLEGDVLTYYKNGVCDFSYMGLAPYEGKQYYVVNGVADTSLNGLFYVFDNGFREFIDAAGEFFIEDEKITELYVIKDGVLDVDYTGAVDMDFHTEAEKEDLNYYYVANGVFDAAYTGVGVCEQYIYIYSQYIPVVPRYFTNGCYDTTFNGMAVYGEYCWKLKDGFYSEMYTGLAKGEDGVYRYYSQSVFDEQDLLAQNPEDGEYYLVLDGVVAADFTGMYIFGEYYGYHPYVVNGKLDATYTGIYEHPENGKIYYILNGYNASDLTGIRVVDGLAMYFTKGVLDTTINGTYTDKTTGTEYTFVNGVQDVS